MPEVHVEDSHNNFITGVINKTETTWDHPCVEMTLTLTVFDCKHLPDLTGYRVRIEKVPLEDA